MSRKVNKLENNSHKRATIINYTSTPKKEKVMLRHYSISLSEINTASSSSGDRKKLQLQMQGEKLLYTLNYISVNSYIIDESYFNKN